ncbi:MULTISPECIES: hypothetical protein [unclassified Bradyrhizobium]|uniref:hypothetical protein n=1 Tax=unclassified Bradyrhizobium TaxID=2631580 RepID=UPI002916A7EB|nr:MULTISPECIES: hypothetical protein [unclassified Bradyrhizobium]
MFIWFQGFRSREIINPRPPIAVARDVRMAKTILSREGVLTGRLINIPQCDCGAQIWQDGGSLSAAL